MYNDSACDGPTSSRAAGLCVVLTFGVQSYAVTHCYERHWTRTMRKTNRVDMSSSNYDIYILYLVLICTVIANALDEYNIIWSYVYIYILYVCIYIYIYILYVHIHPAGIYMHIWSMIHVQTQRAILPSQKSLWRNFEMCHKDHNMHHIYTWKCLRIEFVMHSANLLIVPIRYF